MALTDRAAASAGPRNMKEPGSIAWCWQTLDAFRRMMKQLDSEFYQADEILDDLKRVKVWAVIPPESPYGSLNKMLEAEVGFKYEQVRAMIKTAREKWEGKAPAAGPGSPGYGKRPGQGANCGDTTISALTRTNTPNTSDDYVARLTREAAYSGVNRSRKAKARKAKLLRDDVLNEKITPHAAAKQMGWVNPRVVLTTPEQVARKIQEHWTADQIAQLVALLVGIGIGGPDASD